VETQLAFTHGAQGHTHSIGRGISRLAALAATEAQAANGAYAVDAADISEAGSCKVGELAIDGHPTPIFSRGHPSCVVNPSKPVDSAC